MSKAVLKNLIWMAVPLGLAVGCAANRPSSEVAYGPAPDVMLTPTSHEPEQRIYTSTAPNTETTVSVGAAAPTGASPQAWEIAQEIQQKLLADKTLAPMGSSVIAEVSKDGAVTLRGNVRSKSEEQRVHDSVAQLPGVQSVNDELNIGHFNNSNKVDTRQ